MNALHGSFIPFQDCGLDDWLSEAAKLLLMNKNNYKRWFRAADMILDGMYCKHILNIGSYRFGRDWIQGDIPVNMEEWIDEVMGFLFPRVYTFRPYATFKELCERRYRAFMGCCVSPEDNRIYYIKSCAILLYRFIINIMLNAGVKFGEESELCNLPGVFATNIMVYKTQRKMLRRCNAWSFQWLLASDINEPMTA